LQNSLQHSLQDTLQQLYTTVAGATTDEQHHIATLTDTLTATHVATLTATPTQLLQAQQQMNNMNSQGNTGCNMLQR